MKFVINYFKNLLIIVASIFAGSAMSQFIGLGPASLIAFGIIAPLSIAVIQTKE